MATEQNNTITEQEREFCHGLLQVIFGGHSLFDDDYAVDYSKELLDTVMQNLADLPDMEREVLTMIFRDGKTRREIGEKLNIALEEELRGFEAAGLRMMRHPKRSKKYLPFMTRLQEDA